MVLADTNRLCTLDLSRAAKTKTYMSAIERLLWMHVFIVSLLDVGFEHEAMQCRCRRRGSTFVHSTHLTNKVYSQPPRARRTCSCPCRCLDREMVAARTRPTAVAAMRSSSSRNEARVAPVRPRRTRTSKRRSRLARRGYSMSPRCVVGRTRLRHGCSVAKVAGVTCAPS